MKLLVKPSSQRVEVDITDDRGDVIGEGALEKARLLRIILVITLVHYGPMVIMPDTPDRHVRMNYLEHSYFPSRHYFRLKRALEVAK